MVKFTVRTSDDLAAQVADEAKRRDINLVDLWREAMVNHLARRDGERIDAVEARLDRIERHLGMGEVQ